MQPIVDGHANRCRPHMLRITCWSSNKPKRYWRIVGGPAICVLPWQIIAAITGDQAYPECHRQALGKYSYVEKFVSPGPSVLRLPAIEGFDKDYVLLKRCFTLRLVPPSPMWHWNHRMFLPHGDAKIYRCIGKVVIHSVLLVCHEWKQILLSQSVGIR